jgi:hypothetical protein
MAVTVKRITLWRSEVENKPGALARTLRPLAQAGANLQLIMGYGIPGDATRGAIELFPVSGKKSQEAARTAGLSPASIPTLLAIGDDRPGLGSAIADAIAGAGINLSFLVAQAIGRKYSGIYGFETEEDTRKATTLIKKASRPSRK